RPRRFAPHVYDARTLAHHLVHTLQRGRAVQIPATIREGIRGHVQDTHHVRTPLGSRAAVEDSAAAIEEEGVGSEIHGRLYSGCIGCGSILTIGHSSNVRVCWVRRLYYTRSERTNCKYTHHIYRRRGR